MGDSGSPTGIGCCGNVTCRGLDSSSEDEDGNTGAPDSEFGLGEASRTSELFRDKTGCSSEFKGGGMLAGPRAKRFLAVVEANWGGLLLSVSSSDVELSNLGLRNEDSLVVLTLAGVPLGEGRLECGAVTGNDIGST